MPIQSPKWKKSYVVQKQNNDKIERALLKLRKSGILPREGQILSDEQKKIYLQTINGENLEPTQLLTTPVSNTKEQIIWEKIRDTALRENQNFTIQPTDIIIPTHCPYLNIQLSYDVKDKDKQNYFHITRIDKSKDYNKDNTIIISRKANIIKNLCSSIDEFITLAQNILKIHLK